MSALKAAASWTKQPLVKLNRFAIFAGLLVPATASAFEVKTAGGGTPLRWADGVVTVHVGLEDDPIVSGSARRAALAAMATFDDELQRMDATVALWDGGGSDSDAPVSIRWVTSGWEDDYQAEALAITITSYDPRDGRIEHASIVVNADRYTWIADDSDAMTHCSGAFDLQTVLTHELGHMLGLAHSDIPEATMFPSVGPCSSGKRRLTDDDVRAVEFLYLDTMLAATPKVIGCSVGADAPGQTGAGVLVVGMIGAALLLRRRLAVAIAPMAAILVAASGPAHATTLRRLSHDELGTGAAVVARGTVVAVASEDAGGNVYTDAHVLVTECWKGACGTMLRVRQLGGETATRATTVEGTTSFAVGAEVVLFLRPRRDGTYTPMGMAQGRFSVVRDRQGRTLELVRDLRELYLAGDVAEDRGGLERIRPEILRRSVNHRQN